MQQNKKGLVLGLVVGALVFGFGSYFFASRIQLAISAPGEHMTDGILYVLLCLALMGAIAILGTFNDLTLLLVTRAQRRWSNNRLLRSFDVDQNNNMLGPVNTFIASMLVCGSFSRLMTWREIAIGIGFAILPPIFHLTEPARRRKRTPRWRRDKMPDD